MQMYKSKSSGSTRDTHNDTSIKTASSPEKMAKFGNDGNTHGTRLPKGGCPKGSKAKSY